MRIERKDMAVLAAVAAALAVAPAAAGTGWTTVGSARLEAGQTQASAELRWQPDFGEMMMCVDGGAVKLGIATLRLRDGTAKQLKLSTRVADGTCTPPLTVGRKRDIASVDLTYEGGGGRISLVGR